MKIIESLLRGVGQVMFQNNIWSGLLFLVGICYNSWQFGLAAFLGTLVSTIAAIVFRYSKEDISQGIYGFNGTLAGLAVVCFFGVSFISVLSLLVAAVLSTVSMHYLKRILPPLTAPFVLVTWFCILLLVFIVEYPLLSSGSPVVPQFHLQSAFGKSFGQVMFQENTVTGIIFMLAIFINSKLNAAYAVYAAVLGTLTGWLLQEPLTSLNAGLLGYNAILCAIALSGKKWADFWWITAAIILSTLLNSVLAKTGIITLTAPFVIATWLILFLKKRKYFLLKA
ncbi:urea transporter [Kaistella palustris]|uniref:urea transporter n=1 Tax=Kaistella palustris TaxID=493376 RepID=UPI00040B90CA|nr:urea transporter [Kaistella palustris]